MSHRRWVVCECVSVSQAHSASQYAVKVLAVTGNKCEVEWGYDRGDKKSVVGATTGDFEMSKMSKWEYRYNLGKSLASRPHTADWQLAGC